MKTCRKCKVKKDTALFSKYKRNKDGLHSYCKSCCSKATKEHSKRWRKENKEKFSQLVQSHQSKVKSGIYGIFENGVCLYVGESKKPTSRMNQHKTWIKNIELEQKWNKSQTKLYPKLRQHKHLIFGVIEQCDNHKEREQFYINKLKPMYNGK